LFILDRIEGDLAALEDAETGEITNISIHLLPDGAKEGDALSFSGESGRYIKNTRFTEARVKKINKFLADLWE